MSSDDIDSLLNTAYGQLPALDYDTLAELVDEVKSLRKVADAAQSWKEFECDNKESAIETLYLYEIQETSERLRVNLIEALREWMEIEG